MLLQWQSKWPLAQVPIGPNYNISCPSSETHNVHKFPNQHYVQYAQSPQIPPQLSQASTTLSHLERSGASPYVIPSNIKNPGLKLIRVPAEIKRREVELDPPVSPEEIMSREVELGCESWTSFVSSCSSTAVQRTLSL